MNRLFQFLSGRYFQRPYLWLLISSFIFAGVYVGLLFDVLPTLYPAIPNSEMISVTRGLSVTLFASYLVVVLVDRVFIEANERDKNKRQEIALELLSEHLGHHLRLLRNWYVAALPEEPASPPQTHEELFSENYVDIVSELEFSQEYNHPFETKTWLDHSAEQINEMQSNVNQIIGIYAESLDPKFINDINEMLNSTICRYVPTTQQEGVNNTLERFGDPQMKIFHSESMQSALEDHLEIILRLLDYYEQEDGVEAPSLSSGFTSDNVYPHPGAGRSDVDRNVGKQWRSLS